MWHSKTFPASLSRRLDKAFCFIVKSIAATAISLCLAYPSYAEEVQKSLNAFYSICLVDGPSFERTEASASVMGWKPLSTDALTMFAPREKVDSYKGWGVTSPLYPPKTMVAVTKGRLEGKPVQTCTLAIGDVDGNAFQQALTSRLKTTMIYSDNDGMQKFFFYRIRASGEDLTVMLTLPVDPAVGVFIVGAITETR
jgi:hypothetical protein